MCWSFEVSLLAALYGFGMSAFFYHRGFSKRDPWYALFLASFTCTQLLDAFFWRLAASESSGSSSAGGTLECTPGNLFFSKYVVTPVLFFQVFCITLFPAKSCWCLRSLVRLMVVFAVVGVALFAQCTTMVMTTGLLPAPALVYWGFNLAASPLLFFLGELFWSGSALLFIRPVIFAILILAVGLFNLILLEVLDGTVYLVSRLCFYCLLLSVLWLIEPCWVRCCRGALALGAPPAIAVDAEEKEGLRVVVPGSGGRRGATNATDDEAEPDSCSWY